MSLIDFLACLLASGLGAVGLYVKMYPLALFATLMFFLLVANVIIFHIRMPQPRTIVDWGEPEETEKK